MKKIISFIFAIQFIATSCSTSYYTYQHQVSTVSSENTQKTDEGNFISLKDGILITYNFWRENGNAGFLVTNTNDFDVFLDTRRSFFISNGIAFEYHADTPDGLIRIPAGLSRIIDEYDVTEEVFRYCGLKRNPYRDEEYIKEFVPENTPLKFGNRIMFIVNGKDSKRQTDFYISQLLNADDNHAVYDEFEKVCNGYEYIEHYRYKSPDAFYVEYVYDYSTVSDSE